MLTDTGDSDSDLSDWDDERMLTVDSVIASQFVLAKQSALEKQGKKSAKETRVANTNFKLRVLDLLEVFVRKQSTNPLVIETVIPLLQTMDEASHDKEGASVVVDRHSNILLDLQCEC